EQEVDVAFCRENGIPVFRREVGGGAVYLDGEQLFYQMVIHRDNPLAPASKEAFYRKFLQAPVAAYRALGIPAEYKPVNDIIANGRKISGNGVAQIGEHIVLVGNLIVDFNYRMMARVLKVPDEKFRDKVHKTLQENLSTIRRETGSAPPREELWDLLAEQFAGILGPLELETEVDPEWRAMAEELGPQLMTDEWLRRPARGTEGRRVKIRAGVEVRQKVHKAPGGLIRATAEVTDGTLTNVSLSGDFFFFPEAKLAALEERLDGVAEAELEAVIARFYEDEGIESPGVTPGDFGQVLG
ncbi:MAG: lipoate--protein ligase family protein, partial [Anaerolineales bacterium]